MAQQWTVVAVEEASGDDGAVPYWVIVYQVPEDVSPDGTWRYYLPKAAVEWRAAEYGMADLDEVLELIVHEPILIGLHAAGELQPVMPSLVDVDTARTHIREQLAACRQQYGTVATAPARARSAKAADPLQAIRDRTRLDPVKQAALRLEIDRHRLKSHPKEETSVLPDDRA